MKHKFIVIEGLIGAGKTSLSKKIAEKYNAKLILEQFADNPFLPKFYKEPEKYSFQLELSFFSRKVSSIER
jgi:deoxyguanosine kinase